MSIRIPGRLRAVFRRELVGVAVIVTACSGVAEPPDPMDVTVLMVDNSYDSPVIEVPVGARVTFLGAGRNPHNAVAADGSWSTETEFGSLEQFKGDAASIRFDAPGEYTFYCTFHGTAGGEGMAARLLVGDVNASPAAQGIGQSASPAEWTGATVRVPEDHLTIQEAVDAANPGDLVLIGPGLYREAIEVFKPGLVLRGSDRNAVVIDAGFESENVIDVYADGVAVENLTVMNGTANGIYWSGIRGYRASYVTAIDNGDYGIYAFDSSDGIFEHSYASGSPDSGFYIGQCDPCQAVIDDVIAEWNGLGYSGTNASGELFIINSVWRYNTAGIVPNTLDSELLPPFRGVTIAGNLVHDNDNRHAPMKDAQWSGLGNGIILAGGNSSLVVRNRVVNHLVNGIAVTPNLDTNFWTSSFNRVEGNVVEGSGRADLALAGPSGPGNCFSDNEVTTSLPVGLQALATCDGLRLPLLYELAGSTEQLGRVMENGLGIRPENAVGTAPKPGPQETMPGGADAPVVPAVEVFASHPVDLDSISIPDLPPGLAVDQPKGFTVFGVLMGSVTSVFFGLYAYLLPFVLYAAWVTIALWDLFRSSRGKGPVIGWSAVILLVPFVGVLLYYLFGRSQIPTWQRMTLVFGGLGAYLLILAVGALVGGVV
ncbi:MAG TPA: right-handed parallel beta-helix repeat-containing protein [Acidimicrobiia bacterium]|nr:right-handed parallel beta-helix repeat-containing protein [Acidimicrobiia bacterium]